MAVGLLRAVFPTSCGRTSRARTSRQHWRSTRRARAPVRRPLSCAAPRAAGSTSRRAAGVASRRAVASRDRVRDLHRRRAAAGSSRRASRCSAASACTSSSACTRRAPGAPGGVRRPRRAAAWPRSPAAPDRCCSCSAVRVPLIFLVALATAARRGGGHGDHDARRRLDRSRARPCGAAARPAARRRDRRRRAGRHVRGRHRRLPRRALVRHPAARAARSRPTRPSRGSSSASSRPRSPPWPAGLYQDWLAGFNALLLGSRRRARGAGGRPVRVGLKRDAQAKDAGRLFGAHGGALDRLDAALFTLVAGYYVWLALS